MAHFQSSEKFKLGERLQAGQSSKSHMQESTIGNLQRNGEPHSWEPRPRAGREWEGADMCRVPVVAAEHTLTLMAEHLYSSGIS